MRRRPQRRRRRLAAVLPLLLLAGGLSACSSSGSSKTPTITFYNQPSSDTAQDAAIALCNKQAHGAYKIEFVKLPSAADGQRQQLVRRLAAKDSSIDLMGLDVTWEAEFWGAGWISEWTGANKQAITKDALTAPLATATVDGHLVAAPFTSNIQLLWYRKDLVPTPPKTWAEMIAMSKKLAAQGKPSFVEEQGAQYEGLTVWFNSLVASAGGSILNAKGTAPTLGAPAVQAAKVMKEVATAKGVADPSLSVNMEDQGRLAMEAGSAAFEINYPYVWPSMQADKPKVKTYNGKSLLDNFAWAPIPSVTAGKAGKSSIGGIDVAVSKYSRHKSQDFAAAKCLVSTASQEILANQGGLPPVGRSLYENPPKDFAKAYPFYKLIEQQLAIGAVRPRTAAYQSVSIVISHTLSPPGSISPKSSIASLKSQIEDALHSKGLIP
ncbi:ABC transporter substrate-binding protein [uncultured Jatrophihabitans sp.]|uniref:ABC transporter substrate-binding protein n=1 Tax=uncultured Jatrophihabitans sp. TaxID=1610747 RepID=UPI0035CC0F46